MMKNLTPTLLIIRDGWGFNPDHAQDAFNAVKLAATPCDDALVNNWPTTKINACGEDVGLPAGVMGNSEVGHQNIGAGRIVEQELLRLDRGLQGGKIEDNAVMQAACSHVKQHGGKFHFLGLASDAGVHSMLRHLYALLQGAAEMGIRNLCIHAITDGRDTPPNSGLGYINAIENQCAALGCGKIATVIGRYWAMDRDERWDRVQEAYDCLTERQQQRRAQSAQQAIEAYYSHPIDPSRHGDEFILPTAIIDESDQPVGLVEAGDALIFFNFRGDRPRELTRAFVQPDFTGFARQQIPDLFFASMTEYAQGLCQHVLFHKPPKMASILGEYVSAQGLQQFRCAETEKYPHVTFFFNDYREEPFPGETWKLIPSPKDVATYDQKPEMSAQAVTTAVKQAILSQQYALIIVNYANGDMVGHTGSLEAAIRACTVVDQGVAVLLQAIDQVAGRAIITADHGNADQMWDAKIDCPHTRHTLNRVPLTIYGQGCQQLLLRDGGRLADVAPTLLALMGLQQPIEMTGTPLMTNWDKLDSRLLL